MLTLVRHLIQYTDKICLKYLKSRWYTIKIAESNTNTKAKVITHDGDTSHCDIKAGVLQRDTLASYLFAIILDYTMRQTYKDRGIRIHFTETKE